MVYYLDMRTLFLLLQKVITAKAQEFGDSNIEAPIGKLGIDIAGQVNTGNSNSNFGAFLSNTTAVFVGYIGMAAVIVIIIAGAILVVSGGNEELKSKAQKMITYTIIGMIVVGFATALVTFVSNL